MLAGWSADDVATFAAYLKRFNTDIERLGGRPWPRPERGPQQGTGARV
ncbi:hypothetical protein ACFQYP_15390 [Nonomuraea antimicrobica]